MNYANHIIPASERLSNDKQATSNNTTKSQLWLKQMTTSFSQATALLLIDNAGMVSVITAGHEGAGEKNAGASPQRRSFNESQIGKNGLDSA